MSTPFVREAISSDWFDRYARVGYVAKGVAWAMVGLLAIRVAIGHTGEQADFYGALAEIDQQPLNVLLLLLLALGLAGYAGWRFVQGVVDVEGEGSDFWGWMKRTTYLAVGAWYGFFAVYTVGILAGWSTEDDEIRDWTAVALGWPAGEWIVGTVGLLVILAGLFEFYVAFTGRFEIEVGDNDLGKLERACVLCAGWYGHAARGVMYSALGFFAVRAAVEFDPDEARGLADTFEELLTQPYGSWIVGLAAAGFVAFGVYCLLLALHRHIPNEGILRGRDGGQTDGDARRASAS